MPSNEPEPYLPDCTHIPARHLLKTLLVKAGRLASSWVTPATRVRWTRGTVSDADGPEGNVRNYLDRRTIRGYLQDVSKGRPLTRGCEVGCGYGRVIMVLKEFCGDVVGFEREPALVDIARKLLPEIEIVRVESLAEIGGPKPFDFVLTCTVLQHLTDAHAREVCAAIKRMAPKSHALLIEKTEAIGVTENRVEESQFISRARSIEMYAEFMAPFSLVNTSSRVIENTYFNPKPGTCMLFKSPD